MSDRCSDGRCGADDCERCAPDCNDGIECCSCGTTRRRLHTIECRRCGNTVCETCAGDGDLCPECRKTATDEATLARATAPRVGDVFEWRDSRVTVKCVAADGTVSTLSEHENWYSDASCSSEEWRKAVATVMRHDGVTFTPAHATLGTGCAYCRGDIGEACESALVETPIGRMCPDCAMEWNGRGAT